MARKKSDTTAETNPVVAPPASDQSLGQSLTQARERRGLTRDQVVMEAHVPLHYVKMIETDSFNLISDRLYLVPFLRKYSSFLGLDPEEIAARFVRDVQHSESNVVRISGPLTMVAKRRGAGRRIALGILAVVVLILLVDFVWRHFMSVRDTVVPVAVAPSAAPATATFVPTPAAAAIMPPVVSAVPQSVPKVAPPSRPASSPASKPVAPAPASPPKEPAFDD